MNGFIKQSLVLLSLGCAAGILSGCAKDFKLTDCYDNCWPQRYNYQAEQSVNHPFSDQVSNGHILDQTVWSHHFETGSERLTAGGMEHLAYLARRRPVPDPRVFLQTSQDVAFDSDAPDKTIAARAELDQKRKQAIERFLTATTAGRPLSFDVQIHDPSAVGMYSTPAGNTMKGHFEGFKGVLAGNVGTSSASAGTGSTK